MSGTGARILVVDDEPAIVRAVQANLERRGFRVDIAASGREAIERAQAHPDLILLDLSLPDADGLDLIPAIREHVYVPIIVLSARGGERDKVRALDLGADDYLTKAVRRGGALRADPRRPSAHAAYPHERAGLSKPRAHR